MIPGWPLTSSFAWAARLPLPFGRPAERERPVVDLRRVRVAALVVRRVRAGGAAGAPPDAVQCLCRGLQAGVLVHERLELFEARVDLAALLVKEISQLVPFR